MLILLLKFAISIAFLIFSSTILVGSLTRLSKVFKVSYFAVSFIIMAFATSIPELFVGINSALEGAGNLALGTVLGSNIADLALVFGVVLIILPGIKLTSAVGKRDAIYMGLVSLLPLLLLADKYLSRIDGIILLAVFGIYSWSIFWSKQKFFRVPEQLQKIGLEKTFNFFKELLIFVIGVVVLLIASKFVVDSSQELAVSLKIPLVVVGISVLALSTSLPELVFETKAILSGKKGMALGDLIGSVVANSALVLGVVALISPIGIESLSSFLLGAVFFVFLLLFFIYSVYRGVHRFAGVILIISYIIFLVLEFIK